MKKNLIKLKPVIKYFLVFFFFLGWNLIIQPINLDEIWNYGFSHNIYSGLIPYKDFNMVITPFYPFIVSVCFFLFGSNMLVFHIINGLMISVLFCLLDIMLDKKTNIFILLLCFPLSVCFPSYNLFLLFLFVVLIFLEKNKKSDYLIGVILGFLILTKQSVGACLLLPSIYYFFKERRKLLKRIVGCFIVCFLFLVYLIFTGSFRYFIDLCLLGLFDFASNNSSGFNIILIISIFLLVSNMCLIWKNKKNLFYYYLLAFFSILIPLFDLYHLEIYIFAFLFVFLLENKFKYNFKYLNINLFINGILVGIIFLSVFTRFREQLIFPNKIKHFEYRAITRSYLEYTELVNDAVLKYYDKGINVIFLSADGYYFRIINDMKVGYIDLINSGNWGYNGSDKLFQYVKNNRDFIFFVDKSELGTKKQTDQRVLKYVIDNAKCVDKVGDYNIYQFGEE